MVILLNVPVIEKIIRRNDFFSVISHWEIQVIDRNASSIEEIAQDIENQFTFSEISV
jgi:hypothetical protein